MPKQQVSPVPIPKGMVIQNHAQIVRISSGMKINSVVKMLNSLPNSPIVYDKKIIKQMEAFLPKDMHIVKPYVDLLNSVRKTKVTVVIVS